MKHSRIPSTFYALFLLHSVKIKHSKWSLKIKCFNKLKIFEHLSIHNILNIFISLGFYDMLYDKLFNDKMAEENSLNILHDMQR